jgi:hypothetical protein
MTTANGQYQYDAIFFEKTLDEWIQITHKHNSISNGWSYFPLKRGAFGYDNLAMSIGHILSLYPDMINYSKNDTDIIDALAEGVHKGWTVNYLYWRDHEPWKKNQNYIKPAQTLGDSRRNHCAETQYSDLPEEEKKKDMIIAEFIYDCLNQR